MHIGVIGAGIVGLASAYQLLRAGHEVTVIDSGRGPGLGTSFANGGQLSYGYVSPLAAPGVLSQLPSLLFSRTGPLRIKPSFDPDFWRWSIEFVKHCNAQANASSTLRLLSLGLHSREVMLEFLAQESVSFDYRLSGKLVVYRDAAKLAAAERSLELANGLGYAQRRVDAATCAALEPALGKIAGDLAGGIHTPGEGTGDCQLLCKELTRLIGAHARGTLRFDHEVTGFDVRGDAVRAVRTRAGDIEVDAVVVANGLAAMPLLRSVGESISLYPLKGYSLTYRDAPEAARPQVSVTDADNKVVYASLGDHLRVAGIADLVGYDYRIAEHRIDALRSLSGDLFPALRGAHAPLEWTGMRPATPHGRPILGRAGRLGNMWLNVGHGGLGFTLSMGAARVIANAIDGEPPAVDLAGFARLAA
ncbi:FAD-dependent oxidoreductase [Pandoraea pneumonica]|uniref:FAD-dependent oxidoreductase n=1 Tax=Pandoraea pneumonica TaxID=2508299 RepID=A0A5E4Y145_9BURK|nr:D-amino acid dehydrogenase [Pandoraea pneumonica]VVE42364.1 FAD-dependent oxidoreductase [Pandoraea pneumonica]